MKPFLACAAALFAAAVLPLPATAAPGVTSVAVFSQTSATVTAPAPEAKGRRGGKRVGGSNGKGKGSRYVGGRK